MLTNISGYLASYFGGDKQEKIVKNDSSLQPSSKPLHSPSSPPSSSSSSQDSAKFSFVEDLSDDDMVMVTKPNEYWGDDEGNSEGNVDEDEEEGDVEEIDGDDDDAKVTKDGSDIDDKDDDDDDKRDDDDSDDKDGDDNDDESSEGEMIDVVGVDDGVTSSDCLNEYEYVANNNHHHHHPSTTINHTTPILTTTTTTNLITTRKHHTPTKNHPTNTPKTGMKSSHFYKKAKITSTLATNTDTSPENSDFESYRGPYINLHREMWGDGDILTDASDQPEVLSPPSYEESWLVTPAPCFESLEPVRVVKGCMEDLLLKGPTASIYQRFLSEKERRMSEDGEDGGVERCGGGGKCGECGKCGKCGECGECGKCGECGECGSGSKCGDDGTSNGTSSSSSVNGSGSCGNGGSIRNRDGGGSRTDGILEVEELSDEDDYNDGNMDLNYGSDGGCEERSFYEDYHKEAHFDAYNSTYGVESFKKKIIGDDVMKGGDDVVSDNEEVMSDNEDVMNDNGNMMKDMADMINDDVNITKTTNTTEGSICPAKANENHYSVNYEYFKDSEVFSSQLHKGTLFGVLSSIHLYTHNLPTNRFNNASENEVTEGLGDLREFCGVSFFQKGQKGLSYIYNASQGNLLKLRTQAIYTGADAVVLCPMGGDLRSFSACLLGDDDDDDEEGIRDGSDTTNQLTTPTPSSTHVIFPFNSTITPSTIASISEIKVFKSELASFLKKMKSSNGHKKLQENGVTNGFRRHDHHHHLHHHDKKRYRYYHHPYHSHHYQRVY